MESARNSISNWRRVQDCTEAGNRLPSTTLGMQEKIALICDEVIDMTDHASFYRLPRRFW